MAVQTDDATVRQALRTVGNRTADLIASIDDMERPVPGLDWTVGQVARHVMVAIRGNAASMSGRPEEFQQFVPDVEGYSARMAGTISSSLAAEPVRDPKATGEALREAVNALVTQSEQQQPDDAVQTPWYGSGATLPVAMDTRLMIGELLVHGGDIARGLGRPWPLAKDEVLLVMPAIHAMMPRLFNAAAARNFTGTFRVRLRGGDTIGVRIQRGTIDVAPWGAWAGRADCTLSAEPVAYFLLAYGRKGQWPLIAQGRLLSYGRKPWIALSLRALFVNP
ncbi:MAG TPA: maleylpyruvate isomerase family mycothiol-dependent enzyme [Candidatus Dormibacteraeota bacterium]